MALKRRQFIRKFKLQVLQEADSGKSISQLAREASCSSYTGSIAGGYSYSMRCRLKQRATGSPC